MPFSEPKPSRWSEKHIAEHNVTMDEVAEVLAAGHIRTSRPERHGAHCRDDRCGRPLIVVAADDDGLAFVVTARDMTASEKRAYRRTMR